MFENTWHFKKTHVDILRISLETSKLLCIGEILFETIQFSHEPCKINRIPHILEKILGVKEDTH